MTVFVGSKTDISSGNRNGRLVGETLGSFASQTKVIARTIPSPPMGRGP